MIILIIFAWITIILSSVSVILMPLLIGRAREPYSYISWVANVIQFIIVVSLSARVLGWI